MISRIQDTFQRLKAEGKRAFMPFFCAGDPNLEITRAAVFAAYEAGADIVELGIPFSDPIADGPTIQSAYFRALSNGFKTPQAFDLVRDLREDGMDIPVILMVSVTLVEKHGIESFVRQAADSGVDGLIVPDCPTDRWDRLGDIVRDAGLGMIALVAPNTRPARRDLAAEKASGFIYQMAVTGITGERDSVNPELDECVSALREKTDTPIVIGFGISTPEHVKAACNIADGAIVGSALVRMIADAVQAGKDRDAIAEAVRENVRALAAAAHGE